MKWIVALLLAFQGLVPKPVQAQGLPQLRCKVAVGDTIDPVADRSFGVGDDGIYNIIEPTVSASSELHQNGRRFEAGGLQDYDLQHPWIEGQAGYGIGESVQFSFDLTAHGPQGRAFTINSLYLINGYRKSPAVWRDNTRVKKLRLYLDNKPVADILLADTYKFQSTSIPDCAVAYGSKTVLRIEILEVYPGRKYQDTAIGELQFEGRYSGNSQ